MATIKYKVIKCDECNHEFKLKPKIMKVKTINNQINSESVDRHYFLCPKCKHRYVVMYQDQKIKDNLKSMELIRQKASELKVNDIRYERLALEHNKLKQQNLNQSRAYKRVYGS
ncbi:hypothetical protein FDB55_13205 [Clostridium botulinum]|uniref:Transglycosylase n=1 Tax=Clostridium botulinum TaxID=1491 RepID=A0A6B4JIG9_CLOBO|nr:hypothetical protein [Clostridium botulinum]EES50254.1 conserved hypothetical protein [Clostridium botulinum E1 str. 'BoNT E Beluga']MBY6759738.1 hypothetical protein [Clostridium botulinum]MBY6918647.1 hypothetical protein [Clostridium botulinum]MCR1129733.1 hypothetical protein [Clostridium botulinum]NFG27712.1 hypothetical protein [Clostridium botulinum]